MMDENDQDVFNPHGNKTIDGVLVTPGLWVWDYNLRLSQVQSDNYASAVRGCTAMGATFDGCRSDHWFNTTGGLFNGSRMWVRHPADGRVAQEGADS